MPVMGFLCGAIDMAKEEIAKNFKNELGKYKEIWEIIDQKWDFQKHCHLHGAAYFLNPQFQYEPDVSKHPEIKAGLYNCMEKFIPDENERGGPHMEIGMFLNKGDFFGRPKAEATRMRRAPARWWASYGDATPILTKFAIRVLSLTCSSSACERNCSTFNQVHTKRRNRLHTVKLNALIFIMYNKRLRVRQLQRKIKMGNFGNDPLVVEEVDSDDECVAESLETPSTNWENNLNELDIEALQIEVANQQEQTKENPQQTRRKESQCGSMTTQPSKRGRGPKGRGKAPMRLVDEDEWEDIDVQSDKEDDRAIR